MEEKKFVEGLYYNLPHENAPEFVLGSISIQRDRFMEWLSKQDVNDKGYVKIDFKNSKDGKPYADLNTYKG